MSTFALFWNRAGKPADISITGMMFAGAGHPSREGWDAWVEGPAALVHDHFWITPEEVDERQPLRDPLTGSVMTGCARLDNRSELMASLGEGDTDTSDARLILQAYRKWGTACPERLLGDFAFAIWDPVEQRVFVARDALGAEEMVYTLSPDLLVLASSASLILKHPEIEPELNESMVARHLAVDLSDEYSTFYKGIYHVPPAHCLIVTQDSVHLERYWEIDPERRICYSRDEEYAEHYRELLSEAVCCRLRSAYPVGISLSGGLDSSAITCLAAELMPVLGLPQTELGCYSYVFEALSKCDERKFIRPVIQQAARFFDTRSVMVNGDGLFPRPFDEDWPVDREYPFQDPYGSLLDAILNAARQDGVRLLLSGFYGDDLYSGDDYLFADLALGGRISKTMQILKKYRGRIDLKHYLWDYGLRAMLPQWMRRGYHKLRPVTPDWQEWISLPFAAQHELKQIDKSLFAHPKFKQPGRQKRYDALFFTGYAAGITAYKRTARGKGLVYGFPYFDRRIVEFVLAIPPDQIYLPGNSRKVLRDAMVEKLPEIVRTRQDKADFSELSEIGVYKENWSQIEQVFSNAQVIQRGWISKEWLNREISHQSRTYDGYIFWLVLSLEIWLRKYWT